MIGRDSLVSVIIPVYNGERYLAEAIESALSQDHRPMQVIVVNDGSTDDTEAVARSYGNDITYLQQENRGPAAARNRGLQISQGVLIAFLDVDDLWSRNKIPLQLARLAEAPSVEIVLGLSQPMKLQWGEGGRPRFEKWHDPFCALLLSAGLFRKSVLEKVGVFDETLRYGEDTDWFMRAREMGISIDLQQEVTLFYRRHGSNMTLDSTLRNSYFIKTLKKSLDRRRQQGDRQVEPFPKLNNLEKIMTHRKNSSGYGETP
ncbi:MAG TPA: glycosyltransferase family A protein [Thermodesulfovibrionales bacterium]|jgi:glycosyltransferase involved in cell wall biosynthesis|nr:glycosyltransferase family A protein [Thermodesulfovibrionales bacterium]